ncbi:MAG: inositol monophosphatase [Gammaproteobacteria bacterium]|nr:inositol monophosphatase [Gammaproteobacteria bacterium]
MPQTKYTNNHYLEIAKNIAIAAGAELIHCRKDLAKLVITEKSKNDFVSDVDHAIEHFIIEKIKSQFHHHAVLGEETSSQTALDSDYLWIIDPIDGTNNYLHGLPQYCISIALQIKGELQLGVIYAPSLAQMYCAQKDHGAFLNDKAIFISQRETLSGALCAATIPPTCYKEKKLENYCNNLQAIRSAISGYRYSGSFAYDMAQVATGVLDACWSPYSQPWDIAAGMCIIRVAGGQAIDFEGKTNLAAHQSILAGNQPLLAKLQPLINKDHQG